MIEEYAERVHTEPVVLDIGLEIGALIVYTRPALRGREIEVSMRGNDADRTHTNVHERQINGNTVFAATFQALQAGEYTLWRAGQVDGTITIIGGEIREIDWRDRADTSIPAFNHHDRRPATQRPASKGVDAATGQA